MTASEFDFEGDDLLSKREFSRMSGLAPGKIDALVRMGAPVVPATTRRGGNQYRIKDFMLWLAEGKATPPDELSLMRQRKLKAEAERLEQANRLKSGDLRSAKEMQREIDEGMAVIRAAMLAVSTRLTGHTEEQRAEVHREIVAAINAHSIGAENAVA